ncbi:MAG: hypothetical protein AB4063_06095 [Crocosphaera sp.]
MSDQDPNNNSLWESRIGLALACIVVIAFIIFIFYPPDINGTTKAIIRFLAALISALSAYLFVGNLTLEGPLPFTKLQIRTAGAFATFLAVFFLFFHQPENLDSEEVDTSITYQHYTAQNEFFPLTLSLLKPDINNPIIGSVLSDFLDISRPPFVYKNPVFEAVEKFKNESGNEQTIQEALEGSGLFLAIDKKKNIKNENAAVIPPNYRNEQEISYLDITDFLETLRSEDDLSYFVYAPIINPLNITIEDSRYSSFFTYFQAPDEEINYGTILQFPKLANIRERGIKDSGNFSRMDNIKDFWIRKVIENNPNNRGFLAFSYDYILDLKNSYQGCGPIWYLIRYTPSPYLKFVDIGNDSGNNLRIESITYNIINNNPYQLTNADQRSLLFNSKQDSQETKIVNVNLPPNGHYLVPIEFGFNTDAQKKYFQTVSNINKNILSEHETIYVRKPLSSSENTRLSEVSLDETNLITMSQVKLGEEFRNQSSSIEDLFNLIPKRFAVGSIINLQSIKINGKNMKISSPSDEPTVYISAFLQGGSCPYLMVYDSKKDTWVDKGTILSTRKSKPIKHQEFHPIGNHVSKFRIEERESEITYIDSLSILYKNPDIDKVKEIVYPMEELKEVDNKYLLLHQGESLDIELEKLIPTNASNITLKINGYYEPIRET